MELRETADWNKYRERMLRDFLDLIKIDSPSLKEGKMAGALREKLAAAGMAAYEDGAGAAAGGECGNIIAVLPPSGGGGGYGSGGGCGDSSGGGGYGSGGGCGGAEGEPVMSTPPMGTLPMSTLPVSTPMGAVPLVALLAHMDTVEPCSNKSWTVDGDIVRSNGETILGGDDAVGIIAALEIVRRLQEENVRHGGVMVIFTIAEEVGLLGARYLDRDFIAKLAGNAGFPRFCFVFDSGSPPGSVVTRAPSHYDLTITVKGVAAHAGIEPEKGVNAIAILSEAIANMPLGRIDGETTANIGVIKGGRARNVICDIVIAEGEARSHNEEKLTSQVAAMKKCVADACANANKAGNAAPLNANAQNAIEPAQSANVQNAGGPTPATGGASFEFDAFKSYSSFCLTAEDEAICLLSRAARALGFELTHVTTGGGSDANVLNELGIPAANLPAGMHGVHGVKEYANLRETAETVELVVEAFKQMSSM